MRSGFRAVFTVSVLLLSGWAYAERLQVVADIWCPFNCQPTAPLPGYLVEVLAAVFEQDRIDYQVLPWKRAMLQTRRGESGVALAATEELAREGQLLIGRQSVGNAYDCLYVASGNPLEYHGQAADLRVLRRLGIVLGYEYGEGFGEWLAMASNKDRIFVESGEEPARRNLRKLVAGGLDGVIEDRSVMSFLLLDPAYAGRVVSAGCNQAVPLYLAFSPRLAGVEQRIEQFDQGLLALRRSGRLGQILGKYGLADWQP